MAEGEMRGRATLLAVGAARLRRLDRARQTAERTRVRRKIRRSNAVCRPNRPNPACRPIAARRPGSALTSHSRCGVLVQRAKRNRRELAASGYSDVGEP